MCGQFDLLKLIANCRNVCENYHSVCYGCYYVHDEDDNNVCPLCLGDKYLSHQFDPMKSETDKDCCCVDLACLLSKYKVGKFFGYAYNKNTGKLCYPDWLLNCCAGIC